MDFGGGEARFDDSVLSTNSSEPLSSPPGSPELPPSSNLLPSHHNRSGHFNGVAKYPTSAPMSSTTSAPTNGSTIASIMNDAPAPKKPGRKKKEVNPEEVAAKAAAKKPVVPRKPRTPKDPNAPPVQRKRKAAGETQAPAPLKLQQPPSIPTPEQHQNIIPMHPSGTASKQNRITDLVSPTVPQHRVASPANVMRDPPTPNPRPASSGRMFDPIRGATIDKPPVSPTPPQPTQNRASASPAIKSLMNPAPTSEPLRMVPMGSANPMSRQPSGASISSMLSGAPGPNPIPTKSNAVPTKAKKTEGGSGPPSNAPTPPQQKPKITREAPPLPSGSGLLGGTPFGLTVAPNGTSTVPAGTDIWLKFDLKGKENVTINFAHEVEKKYGFAALNPRLAARKERQRQLALAGAALEKELGGESVDDMSLDSEPESNNDTDGPIKQGEDGEPPKKKRKKRTEDYDRNDDFIDDAELLLEEQALMTKDGFFVYSGPLIQEGERPAVERYVLVLSLTISCLLMFLKC
jgi:hypothetical protein